MARKIIPPHKRDKILARLKAGEDVNDVAIRYNLHPQTIRAMRREMLKAAPPPAPEVNVEVNKITSTTEEITEAERRAAAGLDVSTPSNDVAPDEGQTETTEAVQLPDFSELDDRQLVDMAGVILIGLPVQVLMLAMEWMKGVDVELSEEQEARLFGWTHREKALLDPASKKLASWIRENVGGNDELAVATGGGVLTTAYIDRFRRVKRMVRDANAKKAEAERKPEVRP